jgi:hypothetical protein
METINNAVSSATTAASSYIYGNNNDQSETSNTENNGQVKSMLGGENQEPANGVRGEDSGDPSKPYDGGNGLLPMLIFIEIPCDHHKPRPLKMPERSSLTIGALIQPT